MKKIIALLLALICLTISFVGCGQTECICNCNEMPETGPAPNTSETLEWEYEEGERGIILTKYLGNDKKIVMPSVIGNKVVTQITPSLFAGNIVVEEIVFSENLYGYPVAKNDGNHCTLGEDCFKYCKNLKTLTIPAEWDSYDVRNNFEECIAFITTLNLPNLEADDDDFDEIFSTPYGENKITTIICKNKTYTK
ncbi:MAG: hypothetical protein IJ404_03845 [Clostridia bacterium]|nr:hypothetical protein [Clostridia bacterium]